MTTDLMHPAPTLDALAAELEAAREEVGVACGLDARDKQARAGSLIARLVDALTTTPSEAHLSDAKEHLAATTAKGQKAARAWIINTARRRIEEQPGEAARHDAQLQRLNRAQGRAGLVRSWLNMAEEAYRRLTSAASACESASTTELLDIVSTSKAISAVSYMETSRAAEAIEDARQALRALSQALPKRTEQSVVDQPDDLLDLVVDLTFDPGLFDALSWLNMQQLDDAARQCGEAAGKLQPLLTHLGSVAADAQARAEEEKVALRRIEAPHLEDAAARVPRGLRIPAPAGLDV